MEVAAVLLDLGFHRGSIQLGGASMRERMAGNLMAIAMQPDDLVGIYSGLAAGPLTNQAAGDVEGCAPAIFFQNRRADGCRALRYVVEGEADHRSVAGQPKRCGTKMPGEAVADARVQLRSVSAHGCSQLSWRAGCAAAAPLARKPSQLLKMMLAAPPAGISRRSVRPGSSAASVGSRS